MYIIDSCYYHRDTQKVQLVYPFLLLIKMSEKKHWSSIKIICCIMAATIIVAAIVATLTIWTVLVINQIL